MSNINFRETISSYIFKYCFCSFPFFPFVFPLHVYYIFIVVTQFLGILFSFVCFAVFSLFAFQFWRFLLIYSSLNSFLGHVLSINEHVKAIFPFLLGLFFFPLASLLNSFLESPSLCLHYPSILECCLLFPLNPYD